MAGVLFGRKPLAKQIWRPLWRHCNVATSVISGPASGSQREMLTEKKPTPNRSIRRMCKMSFWWNLRCSQWRKCQNNFPLQWMSRFVGVCLNSVDVVRDIGARSKWPPITHVFGCFCWKEKNGDLIWMSYPRVSYEPLPEPMVTHFINTWRPRQNDPYFIDDILKCIFL